MRHWLLVMICTAVAVATIGFWIDHHRGGPPVKISEPSAADLAKMQEMSRVNVYGLSSAEQ